MLQHFKYYIDKKVKLSSNNKYLQKKSRQYLLYIDEIFIERTDVIF